MKDDGKTIGKKDESAIARQKKALEDKKAAASYLKVRMNEHDEAMAVHFSKGNYALARHDAQRMVQILDLLSEIDLTS